MRRVDRESCASLRRFFLQTSTEVVQAMNGGQNPSYAVDTLGTAPTQQQLDHTRSIYLYTHTYIYIEPFMPLNLDCYRVGGGPRANSQTAEVCDPWGHGVQCLRFWV